MIHCIEVMVMMFYLVVLDQTNFDCAEGYDVVEDFHPEEGDRALSNCEKLLDVAYNR